MTINTGFLWKILRIKDYRHGKLHSTCLVLMLGVHEILYSFKQGGPQFLFALGFKLSGL